MAVAITQVLLTDDGHGTLPFLVGVERRPIHGYPLVMAHRSKLIAATDWTSSSEAYHLLATQHLTDDEWKLFQSLWLYVHGDEQAFKSVTLAGATAEQLRGYLGVDDCSEFRLATQQPLLITDEMQRADAIVRSIIQRVTALADDEERSNAITAFDTALSTTGASLQDDLHGLFPYADNLILPLVQLATSCHLTYTDWNYRGQIANYMPPYIRQWVNDNAAAWFVDSAELLSVATEHDDATVQAKAMASTEWLRVPHYEKLLIPTKVDDADGEHVVAGLARDMLYTPVLSQATNKAVIDKRIGEPRGETAWNALVQQFPDQLSSILAELMHECVRVGRNWQYCLAAPQVLAGYTEGVRADSRYRTCVSLGRDTLSELQTTAESWC